MDNQIASSNILELTADSPAADQIPNIKVNLRPHQLTLLHSCKQLESGEVNIDLSRMPHVIQTHGSTTNISCRIRTNIGIIADKVGSGKSNVILSLIADDDNNQASSSLHTSTWTFGLNNIIMTIDQEKRVSNLNILVIPHNLVNQWNQYITNFFNDDMKYLMISKAKTLQSLTIANILDYRLLVVTTTFYRDLVHLMQRSQLQVKRVFYDEIDMMGITCCDVIDSAFYWFVTASYTNLLYPRGHGRFDHASGRYITLADGMRAGGYLKSLFSSLHSGIGSSSGRHITNLVILKNNDRFVDESINLPPVVIKYIKCRTPRTINILNGIVDREIIQCLNSGNIEAAIHHISPSHKNSENNIIDILLEKYQKNLHNVTTMMNYVANEMQYDTDSQRQTELERLEAKKRDFMGKINSITERIKVTDTCCICYDDISNKTIVNCCMNAYCFKCISTWVSQRHACPLCKEMLRVDNLYVVTNTDKVEVIETTNDAILDTPSETFDKIQNLQQVLNLINTENENSKVLVFSMNERIFTNVYDILKATQRRFKMLKGTNMAIANTVKEYKTGELNTLLVNPDCYGNGINLENTTDVIMLHKFDSEVEKQVIGRAQRYGRATSLRIWYLLYDNEMPLGN